MDPLSARIPRRTRIVKGDYLVRRYRPRGEGLVEGTGPPDAYWRSISKESVLTIFGLDPSGRIAEPDDASRVFGWLIGETCDDNPFSDSTLMEVV